jgi:hypothetical protein
MTYEEFIEEFLALVTELPDETDEAVLLTGFLNEQMALNDFTIPLEELMVIVKAQRPAIAGYLDLIGSRDFKKLFKSELTLEQALQRIGADPDYFKK